MPVETPDTPLHLILIFVLDLWKAFWIISLHHDSVVGGYHVVSVSLLSNTLLGL